MFGRTEESTCERMVPQAGVTPAAVASIDFTNPRLLNWLIWVLPRVLCPYVALRVRLSEAAQHQYVIFKPN